MLRFSSRRRAKATRRAPRPPRGISVIEIMIALTVLGVVMMSLGKLSVMVSMRGRTNELVASRTFAMQQQSNKFSSMPIDSVRTFPTVAQTLTSGSFSYIRRLAITQPVAGVSRYVVKIVIVPLSDTTKKDSLMIDRALPPGNTVLCGGCP
jgi:Tfp pilus assembly protein PilV